MKKYIVWKILGGIVLGAVFITAFGFATMYLWNWLVPALFSGPVLTFWQALGLLLLCKLLFGGFSKGHHEKKHWRWNKERWREHVKNKMEHLSPEEKEKVKNHFDRCMSGRWGFRTREEAEKPGSTEEQ
jgi:ABC-type multidrug transport system fused ATPase/permease subunit